MTAPVLGFIVGVVLGLCTIITLALLYVVYLQGAMPDDEPLEQERTAVDDSLCLDCGPVHVGRDGRCARCGSDAVDRGHPETGNERAARIRAQADDFRARHTQVAGGVN